MLRAKTFLRWGCVLGLSVASVSVAAAAEPARRRVVIEVGNPDFRPYPIAVPELREAEGGAAADVGTTVTKTLRADFELAPIFKLVDPKSYLADQKKEGATAATIQFADWVSVGAEGLVKGTYARKGGDAHVELRFFDVGTGREALKKAYDSSKYFDARAIGHAFADEVVLYLTGSKGIFSTRIAAVRKTRTGREIQIVSLDGDVSPVTNNGSINLLPAWSRDGRDLLFTSYVKHNPNLYVAPAKAGGALKQLSGEKGLNIGGVYSPDGRTIAMTLSRDGNSEIYTMNADGTGLKRLTNEWAIDTSPSWSPDGKQIAFVSARWGDPHIFVMNADGSNVRRLTERGNYNQTPDWSPKGDLIAFTARDERNVFDIFTVNPSTKEIRRLTQDQGNNEEPSFSPDGSLIVFTSTREGPSQLWVMAADGSHQKRLLKEGDFSTPVWSPYSKD